MRDAGVVDEAIEPVVVSAKLVEYFLHLNVIRNIALDAFRLATGGADLFDCLLGRMVVDIKHIDERALPGQGDGYRLADPRSRTGHDGSLSHEAEHAHQCQRDRRAWQV